jgi:GPH family glycoside/pentoside/hexuronide:cation symporter
MAVIFITAICALPLWSWISRRWSKRHAYMGGIAFWATVQLVLITLSASTGTSFIVIICILSGIGIGAAHVLPWAILPDAVEWDEWQTGERHEGMFYSLVVLIQKVASSIAIPLILLILEFTGYVPNATQQPANALLGIRLVIGPIPAILLLTGIFLAFRYPLTRERYEQICRKLEIRRKAKTQESL